MFPFVPSYYYIITHNSKKLRQFIITCFLDNEKDTTIIVFTLTG